VRSRSPVAMIFRPLSPRAARIGVLIPLSLLFPPGSAPVRASGQVLAKVRLQQSEDTMFAVVLGVGTGVVGGIVGAGILSILAIKGDQGEMTRAIMLVAH